MTISSGFATIDTYQFIVNWALAHKGNTPSQSQIGLGCGFSGATAHYHIHVLMEQGLLERIDGELCVTRLQVSVPLDIHDMRSVERTHPEIERMGHVPKDMIVTDSSLMQNLEIRIGEVVDEEFSTAIYPDHWAFVRISNTDSLCESYLLFDENGDGRAVLHFDRANYKASIHFWR